MVRSVERAIDAIETVARHGTPMMLGELASALRAPKSTTLNIARSLVRRRVLEFDARTKTYQLGFLLPALASCRAVKLDLPTLARPHLERLALATQEVVQLSVLDGNEIMLVDKVDSSQPIRYIAPVGARRPLHCTAAGKLTLAMLPAPRVEAYLAEAGLRRYTPTTITEPRKLRDELARIRKRGYSVSDGEFIADLVALAVPLGRGVDGPFVAAIAVAGPAFRMRRRIAQVLRAARRAARLISVEAARFGRAVVAETT